jgi:cytochrome P450
MNFFSDEVRRNPFPLYDQMLTQSPVLHVEPLNLWMVFDYESVKRVMNDNEAFSSSMFTAKRANPEWFIFFDPPRHTKLRALIMRAFTPRMVANLEPRIRELSGELLDHRIERGEMDLAEDYSVPLPMLVIAQMLGVPVVDRQRFKRWADVMLGLSFAVPGGEGGAKAAQDYFAVKAEMSAYLADLLSDRRAAARDDLLTKLVEAEVDGEHLTDEEILGFFQLLLVAGTETTTNLLNNAILCLIENPQQLERLRKTPGLLPGAIEEVLRYRPPVQWMFRATRREVEIQGQKIPAGKLVLPILGAANRDPRQFSEPARFDIAREPNPHIAFGHGIHFCLGAALSRLEARVAIPDLLDRLKDLQLSSSEPWQPRQALHVHGPARLAVRFEPGPRTTAQV